jgi:hypothetical protein
MKEKSGTTARKRGRKEGWKKSGDSFLFLA